MSEENLNQQQRTARVNRFKSLSKALLQPTLILLAGLAIIIALGIAQRIGWIAADGGQPARSGSDADATNTRYICPMMCTPPQSEPGRCPVCGMELVPATSSNDEQGDGSTVQIDPAARRIAGITTARAENRSLSRRIRTVGEITYNEGRQATIAAYVDGRIEKLLADYTGVEVKQGDDLALIYSPELYAAQVELLQATQGSRQRSESRQTRLVDIQQTLLQGARQKLSELGMTERQIQQLEKSSEAERRLTISAPIAGTVVRKYVREGQYVSTGEPIYDIVDLSEVWLMLEMFPEDASHVRYGQRVEAEVQSLPGELFEGRVAFVDPIVDETTRTIGVRVVIPNPDGRLRPGDYATAHIDVKVAGEDDEHYDEYLAGKWISPRHPHVVQDEPGICNICGIDLIPTSSLGFTKEPIESTGQVVVPRSAILMAGGNSVAYVESEPGRFQLRPLTLGPITEEYAVILDGIEAGEQVAVSGNFLIDSQMQLAGQPSLIDPSKAAAPKPKQPDGPLELESIAVEPVTGEAGQQLERLYDAYFHIQDTFASDQTAVDSAAATLASTSASLAKHEAVERPVSEQLSTIAAHASQLSGDSLEHAREHFKPVSKAIIQLAAQARGESAEQPFIHFYCPMVPGGQGDWLQPSGPLSNPYHGSKMLRCGRKIHELPIATSK